MNKQKGSTMHCSRMTISVFAFVCGVFGAAVAAHAQPGTVLSHQKISATEGGFTGMLDNFDYFCSTASLGDLDGDGVRDLAVGAAEDDDGGDARGAVWILFLNTDGTVKSHQKISDTEGGFTGILNNGDWFCWTPMFLGDLDGDGVGDLAVGALFDDDGGTSRGAVWILFLDGICLWDLDANGSVGASDLLSLLVSWGPCKGCPADFDGNGAVGASAAAGENPRLRCCCLPRPAMRIVAPRRLRPHQACHI